MLSFAASAFLDFLDFSRPFFSFTGVLKQTKPKCTLSRSCPNSTWYPMLRMYRADVMILKISPSRVNWGGYEVNQPNSTENQQVARVVLCSLKDGQVEESR